MEQGGGGIRFGALWLILMLPGCAAGLPLREDVAVSGQKFVAAQGEADVVVRTYVLDPAGKPAELGGAACQITTSLYDAKLTTPARLRLPNFGPQSPELFVTCAAEGLEGAARQDINTFWQGAPGFYGGPFYGPFYGPGWYGPGVFGPGWGMPGPGYPVSEYPDVDVLLR